MFTSSLLQWRSRYETWLPNITEIAPLTLLAGSATDVNKVTEMVCISLIQSLFWLMIVTMYSNT